MGGFSSIITPVLSLTGRGNPVFSALSQGIKMSASANEERKQNNASLDALRADINLDREQRAFELTRSESQRMRDLDEALGRQKAQFAAQGLSVNDENSSTQSVLQTLANDSETLKEDRIKIEEFRKKAEDLALQSRARKNLLNETETRNRMLRNVGSGLLA